MRMVVAFAWIMVGVLTASAIEGQSKKKTKEIPTQICKRGNLIFEDDFSGKDLLWAPNFQGGEWKILQGALATKTAKGEGPAPTYSEKGAGIGRDFTSTPACILEAKLKLPEKCILIVVFAPLRESIIVGSIDTARRSIRLLGWKAQPPVSRVCQFPYNSQKWNLLLFEALNGNFSLTLNGTTLTLDSGLGETPISHVEFQFFQSDPQLFAIDEVRVWEALPKEHLEDREGKK